LGVAWNARWAAAR